MDGTEPFDIKNLSSRKLLALLSAGSLREPLQQRAEQELMLRRHYLEQVGGLYRTTNLNEQQRTYPEPR